MSKFRTGDLVLLNRYSIGSIITHLMDPKSRWSDVGIIVAKEIEGIESPYVFMMTSKGASTIPLPAVLADSTLQGGAYRRLVSRDRPIISAKMVHAIEKLKSSKPERIDVIIAERKGNLPGRTGYTSPELVGKVLAASGMTSYENLMPLTTFQAGGSVDKYYGDETPLFPSENSNRRIDVAKMVAHKEVDIMIRDYSKSKPVMKMRAYQNYPPRSVNTARTEPVLLEQMPQIKRDKKKKTMRDAAELQSNSDHRRLERLRERKRQQESSLFSGYTTLG